MCLFYLNLFDKNIGIFQVQVTALNPVRKNIQSDIFNQEKNENLILEQALDSISDKFGPNAIKPARLMSDDKDSPDVIAPAWRPAGYRKSV
jgi:hypothetical protein